MSPGPEGSGSSPARTAEPADRTLRRLLRRRDVAAFLTRELDRLGGGHAIADGGGAFISGDRVAIRGEAAPIVLDGRTIGQVHGPEATALASLLQLLATQDSETRALARESLDRYKELSVLYTVSDRIIRARDAPEIAQVLCREAMQFLGCDSAAALLLNPETGRLEIVAYEGLPFQNRSTREVGDDIVAAVLRSGTGEIVNDVAADHRGLGSAAPLASIVCSPLTEDGADSFYRQFAQADEKYTAEVEPMFGKVRCPVLIVWGEDDPWIPLERGRSLHQLMPGARFETISGVGHMPQLEAPDEVLLKLEAFLL